MKILILGNTFIRFVESVINIFVIYRVFISRHLPLSVAKTIATARINSRLDYCTSLFQNIAFRDITKLQHIHNCLARVSTTYSRFTRSMPLLRSLHQLPVRYCIIFKY